MSTERADDGLKSVRPYGHEPRRRALFVIATLGATLAACSKDDPAAVVPGGKHDDVVAAIAALGSAVDDLQGAVGRFDDDNWREVVPDVKTAAANVSDAADKLKGLLANDPSQT